MKTPEQRRDFYQKNKSRINKQNKETNSRLRYEKKDFLLESLGNHCAVCGSEDSIEIDHINPGLKQDRRCLYVCSWERIKAELESNNLQLLCSSCHHDKSQLQKNTAWYYFKNLPLEEQERLMMEYQDAGSKPLSDWSGWPSGDR